MKLFTVLGLVCFGAVTQAQEIQFNYDRSANFSAYRTYQWVERHNAQPANQLLDQNIRQAIDAQMILKGLQRVETGGDLQIAYQTAIDHEKQFDGWGAGPRWMGPARVTSSTIDIGKLVVDIYDPAKQQLVWRGTAEKTLDLKKDPDKNYQNLQKAMAKLFKNYPPNSGKK